MIDVVALGRDNVCGTFGPDGSRQSCLRPVIIIVVSFLHFEVVRPFVFDRENLME